MLLNLFDHQKKLEKKRVLVEKENAIINHLQSFSMLLACPLSDPPHTQLAADALSYNKILDPPSMVILKFKFHSL